MNLEIEKLDEIQAPMSTPDGVGATAVWFLGGVVVGMLIGIAT